MSLARVHGRAALQICGLLLALQLPVPARAGEATGSDTDRPAGETDSAPSETGEETKSAPEIRDRLLVVGDGEALMELPGSGHRIGKLELASQSHSDVHRILRQVPGVNIQEEDGFGLRPNIGIRGTGVERSQKITLMEDGVLIAPAPYSAPSAYYSPTAGRMEGFEVRKGSSSVRQGPYTTGGAVNYLSTSIPGSVGGRAEVALGGDGLLRAHVHAGGSGERIGWLIEGFHLENSGFKDLDTGGDTGFELDDYLAKLRWTSDAESSMFQAAELKIGRTEQYGRETYLGLTEEDFGAAPYRRYAGSAEDFIVSDHEQVQLTWFAQLTPRFDATLTAYDNRFFRNWHKLESVGGVKVGTVIEAPQDHVREIAILRGELDSEAGELAVRNNRRDYFARGVQLAVGGAAGPEARHDFEIGVRYHQDEEDRFQEEDLFQMLAGAPVETAPGEPGSQSNRVSSADALALFLTDSIRLGRWILTPGIRRESIRLTRRDFGKNDPGRLGDGLSRRDNRVNEWIPGLGLSWAAAPGSRVFFGVHKGFAPPAPGSVEAVQSEESANFELGYRHVKDGFSGEIVGFYNDYDNLLGTDTVSSGGDGTGDQFNGGAARILGLEASLTLERKLGRLSVPVRFAYTWTRGEFRSSFETSFPDWAPAVERGDELPYLPESQLFLGVGVQGQRWTVHLDTSFSDQMRTSASQGRIAAGEGIGSRVVLDLAADYRIGDRYRLFFRARNLADEIYVAARRPAGLRPGLPRTLVAGLRLDF